ncbi:hypothetical protein Cantr_08054 [Candida viswanathii]|uniref:Uncharacterized protein n=1 Tax=Candida viswanathii TaxID=5486 RepID=A0A367Y6U7_9ASCO|nr:hypothetical protein Cantr_08054 [Candida viswanathii]
MLSIQPTKRSLSRSTIRFAARFLWNTKAVSKNKSQPQEQENTALADALNLLVKSTEQVKQPTLYSSLTKGPVEEQFKHVEANIPESMTRLSNQFMIDILNDINTSDITRHGINYSELYKMNNRELHAFISGLTSEESLYEIVRTFHSHNKLTLGVLISALLNKNLKHLVLFPLNLSQLRSDPQFSESDVTKIEVIMLKKHHDLKMPMNVIRLLVQNFESKFLPLIKSGAMTPFYERIVWRFVFEYLKQYKELHYIEQLNNIRSSFLIWETSMKNSNSVAKDILAHHKDLKGLQKHFMTIASADNLTADKLKTLKRMSIRYRISLLDPVDNELYDGMNSVLGGEFERTQPQEIFALDTILKALV